jgi:3-oxoacyl-[acyl-carrier protein] reductase
MKLLLNKTIMITGASKGIGRQMALTFAEHGAKLILNAQNEDALLELEKEIKQNYETKVLTVAYDVKDVNKIKEAFMIVKKEFGHIDGLINNAGILQDRLLGMIDMEMFQETIQTNLGAMIFHIQYASRLMTKQKSGSIVNISSIIGTNGNEGQVVYAASKAGVIGVTKSASKELAKANIRVNAIAPGFIDTAMSRNIPLNKYEERIASIKMKRIGTPEDIANTALFLCSDLSSYVTGQVIGVDGGMII